MAAFDKKKGRLPVRKEATDSATAASAVLQKPLLSNTPKTHAVDYTSLYCDQAKAGQKVGGHVETGHDQPPTINTATPVGGKSTALAAHQSHNTGDGNRSQVVDTHSQRDTARLTRDAAAASAKVSPKACSASRSRRKEHTKERKTLTSPGSAKAMESKTGRLTEAINVCHGAAQEKTNGAASPVSTTPEETRVFAPQEKGMAETTLDSSTNLQQLSQSTTSTTPPASDCSSDESPSSSPDVLEELVPSSGFEPAAAVQANSESAIKEAGEPTLAGMSPKVSSSTNEGSCTPNGSCRISSCGDMVSSSRISSASNWPVTPRNDTQNSRHAATHNTKQRKNDALRGQSPSSGGANMNNDDCHIASSSLIAAGQGVVANDPTALTANWGPSICQGDPHQAAVQNPVYSDQPTAASHPTAAPLPASPHLAPAAEHSVFASADRGGLCPAVEGLTNTRVSPTRSGLRFLSPGNLRDEQRVLHGPSMTEDRERRELQQEDVPVQEGAECTPQPTESFCRGTAGSAAENAARDAVVHKFNTVDHAQCSSGQDSVTVIAPVDHLPPSRVVGSPSTDPTANRVLNKITPTAAQHPPPPPVFPAYPASSSTSLTPQGEQATGTSCFSVDPHAYSTSLNHFSTTLGYYADGERNLISEANPAYTALGQFLSELPQQRTQRVQQHDNVAKLTQQLAGGLESPIGGERHNSRNGGVYTQTGNVLTAGDERSWTSNCAETNGPHWSLSGAAQVMVQPGHPDSTTPMPPPLASPNSFTGGASGETREEGGKHRLVPVEYAHRNHQCDVFMSGTAYAFEDSNKEPPALLRKPFQYTCPPTSVKAAASGGATVFQPSVRGGESSGDQYTGTTASAGVQWCPSLPRMLQGCSYRAGPEQSLGEKRFDTESPPEVPLALMREKQKNQPWQKASGSDIDSTTCSRSQCCSSYGCTHSPTTSLWPQTAALSAERSSFGDGSSAEGGASESRNPEQLASGLIGTVNKNYASRTQDRASGLLDCHTPSKHLLQQERQQVNSPVAEERHGLGNNCLSYGTAVKDTVVDVPRSVSGSNSGMLWSTSVPPVSLLLTLPLNLPYGKIVKFGSPTVIPQSTVTLPPPPPPADQVLAHSDGHRALSDLESARPPLMPRTLGAKKSYYCFSPALHPGAHTLFSHAGGICDTFAASLHLELAILYVPPPLLEAVASIFQALAPRVPLLTSPLKLECGGLEERNAPGRFGGKVLTVSCAVGDQQERYKFQQMQEFLMLFQSKVELLLREYAVQQQLLLGRRFTSNAPHRQGQGGASVPGKKHNIWRYAMSCLPTSLGCQRPSGSSPASTQGNVGLNPGYTAGGVGSSGAGVPADAHSTEGETVTFTGSNNGGSGTGGGGFLDLTIRAFEAKALDKAAKDYARKLVVKDVCVSEIRLVTTRGIEDKTCEIDPRFPQYSIGTRPIVLGPNGQLCRHSFVDVHELPDVWEVRLRPGNTRDEQKRLVERCVLASIENKPLSARNEALKAAIDAGVILWVNGKIVLLPPPPPPALEGGLQQDTHQIQHQKEQQERDAWEAGAVYGDGNAEQQQASPEHGMSSSRDAVLLDCRGSTRPSTQARDAQKQMGSRAVPSVSLQDGSQVFLSPHGDFLSNLLLSSNNSNAGTLLPGDNDICPTGSTQDRETINAAAALYGSRGSTSPQRKEQPDPAAFSAFAPSVYPSHSSQGAAVRRRPDSRSCTAIESLLAPLTCKGAERDTAEHLHDSDGTQYQSFAREQREHETNYLESLAAALAAVPPGLDASNRTAARTVATRDTHERLLPALGEIRAQDEVATHAPLPQTHSLLDVLASGWTQQQQPQDVAEAALKKQHEQEIPAEAQEEHEQCADVKQSICDSVLPVALQCLQQLEDALSSERVDSGAPASSISAETSSLLKRLLSLPGWSSYGEASVQPPEQEELQQQQGGGMDCNMQWTYRCGNGATCDSSISSSPAAAVSAAAAVGTRNRSVIDLAKLLESQDTSCVLKETTAATFMQSVQGGGLSHAREQSDALALSNSNGVNANCNNSSNGSAFPNGLSLVRETQEVGDTHAVPSGALNASSGTSYSYPFRAGVAPARSVLQGISTSLTAQGAGFAADVTEAETAAEAAGKWGLFLGDGLLAPSVVRGLAGSNPYPEELLRRQQLLQGSCAANPGTTDTITFNGLQQCTGAAVQQHVRSRVAQQLQEGKRVPLLQQLSQQLPQLPQTLPHGRDCGQQTATQDLLDTHALQLLRPGSDAPSRNGFLQDFLTGDLLQQYNFRSSSCLEFVDPAVEGEAACNLQYGASEALSQQEATATDNFCDLRVEGIKQQYTYSQV